MPAADGYQMRGHLLLKLRPFGRAGTGLPAVSPYIVGVIDFKGETGKNMVQ